MEIFITLVLSFIVGFIFAMAISVELSRKHYEELNIELREIYSRRYERLEARYNKLASEYIKITNQKSIDKTQYGGF